MIKIIVAYSILFLSSIAVAGDVYTWTDANGVKRFSNTAPPKDATNLGKETNYVAPVPTSKPLTASDYDESKLTRREKAMIMGPERPPQELIIDRQKTNRTVKETVPYKYSWSTPRVSGNELSVSGSVEYGESCKSLTVTAWLFDENSNRTFIMCQASDVGGSGSRILSGKTSIPSRWGSNWKIESTESRCNQ